jgi:hypothetical protein
MALGYYVSAEFLYVATVNVFNVIALLSAILLLLDPILFVAHTAFNYYLAQQALKPPPGKQTKGNSDRQDPRANPQNRLHPKPEWWKWYVVSALIHLLDAWFFRSIIPFYERARSQHDAPPDDLQDLADISRLLWGIVRCLSLFVIALEVWEKRLVLKTVLGQDYKNPKWGFAISYFLAPAIVAIAASPVAVYLMLLALRNSIGFFWGVVKEAFTPDWRTGQDVFVKTATETATVVAKASSAPGVTNPFWKVWT